MEVWGTPVRGTAVQAPGRLEVIGAEDGFIREPYVSVRRMSSSEKADALIKGSRDWQKGKLQVLGGKEASPVNTPPRQSSVGSKQVYSRKKVYTPTKQISLCTARSTPEIDETPSEDSGDKKSICNSAPNLKSLGGMREGEQGDSRRRLANAQSTVIVNHNTTEKLSESTDDDDDDDDDTDSVIDECEENEKAPIELMAEFLKAIMERDYNLASKLCQMILLYEPDNCEAQHFVPLIKEKLLMEENDQNSENEDDEEDSEDSDSEESTDDSNTDDSSDEASDSSSDPAEDS
ncbi:glutamate-rich protein 2 [Lissotriton helveticus]